MNLYQKLGSIGTVCRHDEDFQTRTLSEINRSSKVTRYLKEVVPKHKIWVGYSKIVKNLFYITYHAFCYKLCRE